jgi:RNA polymerase sigma factor (TIGR02999 family)
MSQSPEQAPQVVDALRRSEREAADDRVSALYDELRVLAVAQMRHERRDHTLQATAVIHDAYIRLVDQRNLADLSRQQFLALAAQVVRRVLVDHAKAVGADKRGGGRRRVTLYESTALGADSKLDVLIVDDLLNELSALNPRHAKLVELRVFAGLSNDEISTLLGVSLSTVEKDWRFVRLWLRKQIGEVLGT